MHRILLVFLSAAWSAHAQEQSLPHRYESLAAAEREFADAGLRDGVQKSFLAHFAQDAVVLQPFAVSAPPWYREHPDHPGKLIWGPQYLAVSAAGDLGLSSGPWRYEAERDGKAVVAHGHFMSIWRRDPQGRWQVLLDNGIGHAAPSTPVESTAPEPILAAEHELPTAAAIRARAKALAAADAALRDRLGHDAKSAYATVATDHTLWLREGALPIRSSQPPAVSGAQACGCGPRVRLAVAASGDLGYTLGGAESARARGIDIRVWRYEGSGWKLLADQTAAVE